MNLAAIVLAAGAGRRFGGGKLAAPFLGEPLIAHAIRAARSAPVSRVIVACPPLFDAGDWPGEPHVTLLPIASPALSASLKAAIAAAQGADGAFVFLGDMPLVPRGMAGELAAALGSNFAAVPRHAGRIGHPVLLAARAFPEVMALTGDQGAGRLIRAHSDVAFCDTTDEGIFLDIDRAEDIARLERRRGWRP